MLSEKKRNKKNGSKKRKDNCSTTNSATFEATSLVAIVKSEEEFKSCILKYITWNHGVIISPWPSMVIIRVALKTGRKLKAKSKDTSAVDDENYTAFLCHFGNRAEEILHYDTTTNVVDVCLVLNEDCNDLLVVKVPSQALVKELSSFPNQNETTEETIIRLLWYEFTFKSVHRYMVWRSGDPSCTIYRKIKDVVTVEDITSMNVQPQHCMLSGVFVVDNF